MQALLINKMKRNLLIVFLDHWLYRHATQKDRINWRFSFHLNAQILFRTDFIKREDGYLTINKLLDGAWFVVIYWIGKWISIYSDRIHI